VASISYNRIILVGRLTRDPEVRYTASGTQVSSFTLAVDRPVAGSDTQNTDFIPIVTFGKLAEFVSTYLTKGRLVLVEGSLRIRKWQNQLGETRRITEVWADTVRFMETKKAVEAMTNNITETEITDVFDQTTAEETPPEDLFDSFDEPSESDEPPF